MHVLAVTSGHLFYRPVAGYSATPVQKKLGIKEGFTLFLFQPPDHYFDWISPLPKEVTLKDRLSGEVDFMHLFVKDQKTFAKEFLKCKKYLKKSGLLWISWPKKASRVVTDLDENVIREFGLKNGLVDVKVCAVDEIWSGLKFVFRIKDR